MPTNTVYSIAEIHDVRRNGYLFRYCAKCDSHYVAGTFGEHKETEPHLDALSDAKKMQDWYKANGI